MSVFKNSISRKLIIYVILFSSLITFITSVFQLLESFNSEVKIIHLRLEDVFKYYTQPVTNTLWTSNYSELKSNLEGIIKIPNINYIQVSVDDAVIVSLGERKITRVDVITQKIIYRYKDNDIVLGSLLIEATLESAYQNVFDKIVRILISNGIKTFLVTFFILFIFNKLVTRHLLKIAEFTQNLTYKQLNLSLSLDRKTSKRRDELDNVVIAITEMQENIQTAIKKMELSEAKVLLLLNSTAEAIYGIDTFGVCSFVNKSCLTMLGYEHESELLGKNMHELIHYNYSDGRIYQVKDCRIYQAYLSGIKSHQSDEVLWRKDGSCFAVEYWSYPIFQEHIITGAVVTFIDITSRLAADTEIRHQKETVDTLIAERTTQLEFSNRALDSFSYSVSHDLRTPLRAIYSFCQLLIEDHGDEFNDDARKYFTRITNAVNVMSTIIDDLLLLASVSQSELIRVRLDNSKIIHTIFNQLQKANPERQITIEIINNELNINCDKNLITLLWENLIQNAWKYTVNIPAARIEIGLLENTKTIYIKDNGVGFDMKFVDKIFLPFQRLHKSNEFEGTGIGLATVARIIDRHGGKIWAESIPQQATTIFFSLDNTDAQQ